QTAMEIGDAIRAQRNSEAERSVTCEQRVLQERCRRCGPVGTPARPPQAVGHAQSAAIIKSQSVGQANLLGARQPHGRAAARYLVDAAVGWIERDSCDEEIATTVERHPRETDAFTGRHQRCDRALSSVGSDLS